MGSSMSTGTEGRRRRHAPVGDDRDHDSDISDDDPDGMEDRTSEILRDAAAAAAQEEEDDSDSNGSADMEDDSDDGGDGDGDGNDDDVALPEPLAEIGSDVDDDHTFSLTCITSGVDGETTAAVRAKLSRDMKGMAVSTERIVRLCPFGPDPRMVLCNLKMLRRLLHSRPPVHCIPHRLRPPHSQRQQAQRTPGPLAAVQSAVAAVFVFSLQLPHATRRCPVLSRCRPLTTVSHNRFSVVPDSIRSLTALDELDSLPCCPFSSAATTTVFTHAVFSLAPVGSNDLCDVPEWFPTLNQLQLLYCLWRILACCCHTRSCISHILLVRAQWTTTRSKLSRTRFWAAPTCVF